MYTKFFGLEKRPFVLSPDPEFLFFSQGHDLAFTHLEYGLHHNVGFMALTGEVGAGKTTLLKYLFDKVAATLDIAMIFNTNVDAQTLLEMLVREFELELAGSRNKSDLFDVLFRHFMKQYSTGNRCVIVVDEAQNLPADAFEELRMLSNLEVGNDFLVQIILVGQPQLRERLARPSLSQLAQRISVHYHLAPLAADEVEKYIHHRLKIAGLPSDRRLFDDQAVQAVAEASHGIPRIVNSLCDAALTYAFADDLPVVTKEIVEKVVADNPLLHSQLDQSGWDGGNTGASHAEPVEPERTDANWRGYQIILSHFQGRLESVETRLKLIETAQEDRVVQVLQEMLNKERERNLQYFQRISLLTRKFRDLQGHYDALRIGQQAPESEPEAKPRKKWGWFGGSKN